MHFALGRLPSWRQREASRRLHQEAQRARQDLPYVQYPLPIESKCQLMKPMCVVASKCGFAAFEDGAVTNSPEHIHSYIDGTIERLGFAPDLYYLHRIDPSMCLHLYHQNDLLRQSTPRHTPLAIHPSPRRNPRSRQDKIHRSIRMLRRNTPQSKLKYDPPTHPSPHIKQPERKQLIPPLPSQSRQNRRHPSRILRLRNPPRNRRPHRHRPRAQHRLHSLQPPRPRLASRRLPLRESRRLCSG